MGRQTAVALSEEDEDDFLDFLRADSDIRIYQWAASSPELLGDSRFPPRGPSESSYRLWNAAFPWVPEYGQWQRENVTPALAGRFYLKNTAGAPVLEYSRQSFSEPKPLVYGRVYWNTDFAIYRGPEYDTAAFGRWYDHVVRWLRKNGRRVEITRSWCQYWLPGAWAQRPLDLRS